MEVAASQMEGVDRAGDGHLMRTAAGELERLPRVVDDHLPGPYRRRHLSLDLEGADVVVGSHALAVTDAAALRVGHAHVHHRLTALQTQQARVGPPHGVD